jgi:gliding motility-associated-like protein
MSSIYQRKKGYCLLAVIFLVAFNMAYGQGYNTTNWRFSNPRQFGFTVLDLDYADNNNVIAVGSDGGIAKSTDGGTNWTYGPFTYINPQGLLTKASFQDVHYISPTIAYASGDRGLMAKTIDGGITWSFITTPLFANSRNINACWFVDANRGYIGGQWNTPDSLPKLYFTLNGGASWDSIAAPAANGTTKVGFVSNVTYPAIDFPVTAKSKEIQRIEFISNNVGYICGSGASNFPNLGIPNITSSTTCALTGTQTTGSHNASLLWKFENGVLTDYSISKERLGYNGIPTTLNCTSKFGTTSQCNQLYRALNIINDSLIVMMSFNNNVVIRVRTGKNDSTQNINRPAVFEKGKFEVLNTGPSGPPPGYPPIPAVQNLFASNPYHMIRNTAGTLVTGSFNNIGGPGFLWTSNDTGRTWAQRSVYPQGRNWSPVAAAPALDFAPNGKLLVMGNNGIVGDSAAGGAWQSNYLTVPVGASYNDLEFADCNNGIAAGGSSITTTTDGGQTWIDRANSALAGLFANITSVTYPLPNKVYFTTNIGTIYRSINQGSNLNPVFIDNYGGTSVINDLAVAGTTTTTDSIWGCGSQGSSSVLPAQRFGLVYRSFNNGATWDTIKVGPLGTTGTQAQQFVTFRGIEFPSRNVGYICGNRGAVYKTTNAGTTWTNISPFPAINISPAGFPNAAVSYSDILALDENTVFVIGNMFTNANNRRIYKTTDGGATWTDISSNIGLLSGGNLNGILMHDVNNGYVAVPGGVLYKTNNGGTSWTMDLAPSGTLTTGLAFAPKRVPPAISVTNRKLFVVGPNINGAPILEYGNPLNVNVNATEAVINPTCSNLSGGSITVNATGGIAPYTYSINGGPFQSSNVFSGLTQGVKSIVIRDAYCGTLTRSVTVGFNDNLTLTTSNDTSVCAGAPVPLIATSAATSYSWSPAAGLSNAAISNPVAIVNSNASYTVTATLNGCVRTRTVNINIRPNPIVSAGADKTIVDGDAVMLDGTGNANSISVAWTPASTLTGANTYTPVARPNATTIYTLTVRDANGCTSTDNATVTVIPYCIKIMDAFSPNGDGINDKWLVTNGAPCANQIIATVFNRYGSPVFKSDNYQNAWDGTYKGKPVPDGTYYYAVTFRLINGRSLTLKGDVTILR